MIRRLVFLCWTTALLSVAVGFLLWGLLKVIDPSFIFMDDKMSKYEWSSMLLGTVTMGLTSLIGFIAYLFARFYMIGILRNRQGIWTFVQCFFIVLALTDTAYLRYGRFAGPGQPFAPYLILPLIILLAGLIVAAWKVKLTNRHAFLPTLFFIVVLTTLEAIPAMQANDREYLIYVFTTLFVCNGWQILIFHRLTDPRRQASGGRPA